MTPSEAAKLIGCSTTHVRKLIRDSRLQATKVPNKFNQYGYVYAISVTEARRFKKDKPYKSNNGDNQS